MMIFHIVGGGVYLRVLTGYIVHTAQNMIHTDCQHCSVLSENIRTFPNISNLSFKFRRSDGGKGSGRDGV